MGQATVDLPDSSSNPPVPDASNTAPGASADDLLSQLAGEEIDRMLSAADADTAAGTLDSGTDAVDAETPAPETIPEIAEPTEPAAAASSVAPLQEELDQLLSQFTDKQAEPAEPPTTPEPIAETASFDTPEDLAAVVAETPADATGPAERAALVVTIPSTQPLDDLAGEALDESPLPFYLRPLEWINAPLAMCPESVRSLLGMIGILTTINALAVLMYVIIFRHHPR